MSQIDLNFIHQHSFYCSLLVQRRNALKADLVWILNFRIVCRASLCASTIAIEVVESMLILLFGCLYSNGLRIRVTNSLFARQTVSNLVASIQQRFENLLFLLIFWLKFLSFLIVVHSILTG